MRPPARGRAGVPAHREASPARADERRGVQGVPAHREVGRAVRVEPVRGPGVRPVPEAVRRRRVVDTWWAGLRRLGAVRWRRRGGRVAPVGPAQRLAGEEGQVLLLGVGTVALVAALLLVVATATSVYLDLKHLTSLADSAAAAAADSVDYSSYYGSGVSPGAPGALTDQVVIETAQEDLGSQLRAQDGRAGGLSDVRISQAYAQDAGTAVVTLTARSQPPFLPWGILPSGGFTLTATGSAAVTSRP